MHPKHKEILSKYFPHETLDQVVDLVEKHNVQLKFTAQRNSKLGDYRPPGLKTQQHRVTINGNLNPWFLYLVFLHELAHLLVWSKYQNKVSPHGSHWKQEFACLLKYAVFHNTLPPALHLPVLDFCKKVKATFASHPGLWKALKSFDKEADHGVTVEDIPYASWFVASNGRVFQKEERIRTRYRCYCANNKKRYLFHPLASITPVEGEYVLNER